MPRRVVECAHTAPFEPDQAVVKRRNRPGFQLLHREPGAIHSPDHRRWVAIADDEFALGGQAPGFNRELQPVPGQGDGPQRIWQRGQAPEPVLRSICAV